jgi:hypothetical protein
MADIRLKKGQTGTVTFAIVDDDSVAFDLTGFTVTLVIATRQRFERVGVVDVPATLGTGAFDVDESDYEKLRPGEYVFEVWAKDSINSLPVYSGTLEVVDVPQLAAP